MAWDFSCVGWEAKLRAGHPPIPDLPLDTAAADKAVSIYNRLRLHDVVGTPTRGEAGGEWFRQAVVRPLFGSQFGSLSDGTCRREIREIFLLVPKKNDKTGGGAAVMMTALILNKRPRGKFLLVAPSHEVAEIAFAACVGMIEEDDRAQREIDGKAGYLKHIFKVQAHLKKITKRNVDQKEGLGATLQIKTFDQKIVVGAKPVGILLDEFWELAKHPKAANIMGQLSGGQLPIPEAFRLIITTESDDVPVGVFKEKLHQAREVRDGLSKGGMMLPVLYEFSQAMMKAGEWRKPEHWAWVNPNINRSISIAGLQEIWSDAETKGDAEMRRAASQHFNIEIGMGLGTDRWSGADYWEKRADKSITLDSILARCEAIVVGIDGGGADDLFGLVVMGRETGTKRWLVWSRGWCFRKVLERRKSIASALEGFEKRGELTIIDDNLEDEGVIPDIPAIVEVIKKIDDAGLLACVAMDPEGLGAMVDALADIGVTQEDKKLFGIDQRGHKLMNALRSIERKLIDGTFIHSDCALLNWCVENLKIEATATAFRATKQFAGDRKIDLAMAMFDAGDRMSTNPVVAPRPEIAAMVA
ncbi:MAG: terminase large subunit [Pseudolabrys sp.]|nr:terminase large subunit [Pseudolabrys sp.]